MRDACYCLLMLLIGGWLVLSTRIYSLRERSPAVFFYPAACAGKACARRTFLFFATFWYSSRTKKVKLRKRPGSSLRALVRSSSHSPGLKEVHCIPVWPYQITAVSWHILAMAAMGCASRWVCWPPGPLIFLGPSSCYRPGDPSKQCPENVSLVGGLEHLDYFYVYIGNSNPNISQLTDIFRRAWNHQPGWLMIRCYSYGLCPLFSWRCVMIWLDTLTASPKECKVET